MPGPQRSGSTEPPEALFERSLERIERVVSRVSGRLRMSTDEAEEFRSWVHLKLIEHDYRVLRRFSGSGGMTGYLTSVVLNLARDFRTSRWGRWRPSAAARRLGLVAMRLETLLERDDFSFDEAVSALRSNHGVKMSRHELAELAARLPRRVRLQFEREEALASVAGGAAADRAVRASERIEVLERAQRALARSLAELGRVDRLVLEMHYERGERISTIAAALELDQRRLYTRRDRCQRRLRRSLREQGLEASEVLDALGWAEAEFAVDYGLEGAPRGAR